MESCESSYNAMIDNKLPPQIARECLPNSTKTEVVITANLREWLHIFTVRTSAGADDGIKDIMSRLLVDMKSQIPVVFDYIPEH